MPIFNYNTGSLKEANLLETLVGHNVWCVSVLELHLYFGMSAFRWVGKVFILKYIMLMKWDLETPQAFNFTCYCGLQEDKLLPLLLHRNLIFPRGLVQLKPHDNLFLFYPVILYRPTILSSYLTGCLLFLLLHQTVVKLCDSAMVVASVFVCNFFNIVVAYFQCADILSSCAFVTSHTGISNCISLYLSSLKLSSCSVSYFIPLILVVIVYCLFYVQYLLNRCFFIVSFISVISFIIYFLYCFKISVQYCIIGDVIFISRSISFGKGFGSYCY